MYLSTKGIEGAAPKKLVPKGRKHLNFFQHDPTMNDFYNKQSLHLSNREQSFKQPLTEAKRELFQ